MNSLEYVIIDAIKATEIKTILNPLTSLSLKSEGSLL